MKRGDYVYVALSSADGMIGVFMTASDAFRYAVKYIKTSPEINLMLDKWSDPPVYADERSVVAYVNEHGTVSVYAKENRTSVDIARERLQ